MSDLPTTGEWTVEAREAAKTIQRNYDRATYKLDWVTGVIQEAITAAVAAEREKREQAERVAQVCYDLHEALGVKWGDDPYAAIQQLREQLADEREKLDLADRDRCRLSEGWTLVEQQLAAERGCLDAVNDLARNGKESERFHSPAYNAVQQLRSQVQTLVDALTWYADESIYPLVSTGHLKAQNALAKVKEGKA